VDKITKDQAIKMIQAKTPKKKVTKKKNPAKKITKKK
jgi:DNA topoisomerase-1